MTITKTILKTSFLITWIFFGFQIFAQETLQQKYQNMLEETETFERYKVIPKATLDAFWGETRDSVRQGLNTISDLRMEMDDQQSQIDSLKQSLSDVQAKLHESLELNDTIFFLGIPFSKLAYHILAWTIILILGFLAITAYLMFIRSNKITARSRKELDSIKAQFEAHKDKAREKQVKLKRELQTAINTIDEIKRGKR